MHSSIVSGSCIWIGGHRIRFRRRGATEQHRAIRNHSHLSKFGKRLLKSKDSVQARNGRPTHLASSDSLQNGN